MIQKIPLYRWLRRLGRLYVGSLLIFLIGNQTFHLPPPKNFSPEIYAADSTLLCAYLTPDDKWRLETHLAEISEDLKTALIQKEDKYFYLHPGVNPFAIVRALASNVIQGKRVSGASTISMQLARMAEPKSRTYGNKLKEMFRALQYEWHYPKDRIFELYMSYLPYGGNIEGVHAASYLYFDRPPGKLSLAQAVLLAVIPNRPNSLRIDRFAAKAQESRDRWLKTFEEDEVFAKEKINIALLEAVPQTRLSIQPKTPHLCNYLRNQYPTSSRLFTHLQPATQQTTSSLLQNHVRRQTSLGVSNGAVLVVDNRKKAVVAYCGSADFWDASASGQVDGIQALRSPGSTLKPAVYAQAMDMGLATPRTPLLDVPTTYQGFSPENYDLTYWGQTNLHNALAYSRNIPVVRLGDEIGLKKVLDLLEQAGFEDIHKRRKSFGLSVILGGCGVTLEQLTRFYTSFAHGGDMHELSYLKTENQGEAKALFSAGSSFMIADILSDLERPDLPSKYLESTQLPRVAWKTGTSYGRRDAWSIGFSPRYTIGVWMGNFDGEGVPEMSGTSMAVPLLIDLFDALDYGEKSWFEEPPEVSERWVCQTSGLPTGKYCTHKAKDLFIANRSPLNICDQHQELLIKSDSSMHYCPHCLPPSGFGRAIWDRIEPELSLWYEQHQINYSPAPPHNPNCETQYAGIGPKILSPSPDLEYLIEKGNEEEILLQAVSGPEISKHYWYVNGKFLKAVAPHEQLFVKPEGKVMEVSCVDDKGRKAEVKVRLGYY